MKAVITAEFVPHGATWRIRLREQDLDLVVEGLHVRVASV
jgi:hypothetical protein